MTPDPPDGQAASPQRKGRYCGWQGKDRFDYGALRLRGALTKLARDPDPAARAAGVALSDEAADLLHQLATRADNATTRARRAQAAVDRLGPQLDQLLQQRGGTAPPNPKGTR